MLHIVLWKWKQPGFREPYKAEYVDIMHAMLFRNLRRTQMRVVCVTDDVSGITKSISTFPLWNDFNDIQNICGRHLPSCYRRLKLFDPMTQREMGIKQGDRILSIDLDTVILGNLDELLRRQERFVGWAVRGSRHPTVFNGSMFLFTAGDLENIWTEFDPIKSPDEANKKGYMGSDQSWLSYKLIHEDYVGGWKYPSVVSYPREIFRRPMVPNGCRIAFFHGKKKPWHEDVQREAPWIAQHWKGMF